MGTYWCDGDILVRGDGHILVRWVHTGAAPCFGHPQPFPIPHLHNPHAFHVRGRAGSSVRLHTHPRRPHPTKKKKCTPLLHGLCWGATATVPPPHKTGTQIRAFQQPPRGHPGARRLWGGLWEPPQLQHAPIHPVGSPKIPTPPPSCIASAFSKQPAAAWGRKKGTKRGGSLQGHLPGDTPLFFSDPPGRVRPL